MTPISCVGGLGFDVLGYVIVGVFLGGWPLSIVLWKVARLDERHGAPHAHVHPHAHDGREHSHRHFH